ncbi:MAG: hypothetical protein E7626_03090 [Ruminococcaceae bacterium]|nr:hypothetical protein [Oscillospiraceae bacterium]
MAKTKNKVICRHGKKSALRCPLSFDSSELYIDGESSSLFLGIVLTNSAPEDGGEYIESAALVIRCFDTSGDLIVSGGREIISKTLKFSDGGIAPGTSVEIKTKIDLPSSSVSDFDAYIGCIRTAALVVTDFVRADFFDEPDEPIPLSVGMSEEEIYDVCDKINESAIYYPDELSSLVWRCTCGEISDGVKCSKCSTDRAETLAFFSKLVRPTVKKSAPDKKKRLHLFIAIFASLFFVATLLLAVLLVFFLSDGRYGGRPSGPDLDGDKENTEIVETLEEKLAKLDAMLSENDFASALAYASENSDLSYKIPEISEAAVKYYIEKDDYDNALKFAESSPSHTPKSILLVGYAHYISNKIFDKALEYAKMLGDSEKVNTVIINKIDYLVSQKKFSEAIELAVDSNIDTKKEEVISAAVKSLSAEKKYDEAFEFALLSNKESVPDDLAKEAVYYYLENKQYDAAVKFADRLDDESVMRDIAANVSDKYLKKNLGTLFKYLSFERKQSVYATPVSLDKQIAVISTSGKVIYGSNETYIPSAGKTAVSVKASAHHTVILLSDGSVVAFGDNSFGQCDVSLLRDVVAIDVGAYHTLALLADGSVRALGNTDFGQCSVSDIKNAVMIAAGDFHSLILLSDGSVKAVGNNASSQCETDQWSGVVMISAGSLHSVCVTADGKALAVGSRSLGRCDVSSWSDVLSISAGSSHTVAILSDGSIVSCGGVVGSGNYGSIVSGEKVIYAEAGNIASVAVTESGKLILVGSGLPSTDHVKNEKVDPEYFFTSEK